MEQSNSVTKRFHRFTAPAASLIWLLLIWLSLGTGLSISCQAQASRRTDQTPDEVPSEVHRIHSGLFNVSDLPSHRMTLMERAKKQGDIEMAEGAGASFSRIMETS